MKSCPLVLAVLQSDMSDIGVSHQDIQRATGLDAVRVSAAIRILRLKGRMFVLGKFHDSRYFASSERMESCRAAFDAYMAELTASRKERAREKRNARGRVYWAEKPPEEKRRTRSGKKKAKPKAEPKPRHRQKPPTVSAPVTVNKKPQGAWKNAEPITPPHVKVQELPGCPPDRRFHVPMQFKGEFCKEWQEKRSGQ